MNRADYVNTIKAAMNASKREHDDAPWEAEILALGFKEYPDTGTVNLNVDHVLSLPDGLMLRLNHRWFDTSGPFSPGPDRTRLTLEVSVNGLIIDQYTVSWDD